MEIIQIKPIYSKTTAPETRPTAGSQALVSPEFPMPPAIVKAIKAFARKYAALDCSVSNHQAKVTELEAHERDGTIPKHLQFKMKKLFVGENEGEIRTMVIKNLITTEINEIKAKIELNQVTFNGRLATLQAELGPILVNANLRIQDAADLKLQLDYEINSFKAQFLIKKQEDEAKKAEKQRKFLEYKERMDLAAELTKRDVSKANKVIANLAKEVKQLKVSLSKVKGNVRGSPAKKSKTQGAQKPKEKSTGTTKNSNGKGKSTAKNKKSRGKSGKQ